MRGCSCPVAASAWRNSIPGGHGAGYVLSALYGGCVKEEQQKTLRVVRRNQYLMGTWAIGLGLAALVLLFAHAKSEWFLALFALAVGFAAWSVALRESHSTQRLLFELINKTDSHSETLNQLSAGDTKTAKLVEELNGTLTAQTPLLERAARRRWWPFA
jgi:hypothetical protein